jgi:hypothetical protein
MNDLGTYVVLAENEAGKDQTFCTVFIQQMPNIDQTPMVNPEAFKYLEHPPVRKMPDQDDNEVLQPPKVIIPLQDLKMKEGEPVLLLCKIEGNPKPKVSNLKFFQYLAIGNTLMNVVNKLKRIILAPIRTFIYYVRNPFLILYYYYFCCCY